VPYKSEAQSRYIHMQANRGKGWAKRFVRDAQHGEGSVKALPQRVKHRIGKPRRS
jgi:hypothetical protein